MPEPVREVGGGLPRAQPRGDRAEHRATPGLDDNDLRRAAAHRRAEEHDVRPPGERCIGGDDSRLLFHRERLARHARFAHKEVARLEDSSIGGNQVAGREHEDVARDERVGLHRGFDPSSRTTRQISASRFFSSSTAAEARYS